MLDKVFISVAAIVILAVPAISLAQVTDYNAAVEPTVRAYFADAPVMIDIADCESQFHQFNDDGSVLHGGSHHTMTGIYQIARLHKTEALEHGFDIDTIAGNIAYAKYLYDREGTTPWLDSSSCWASRPHSPVATTATSTVAMTDRDAKIALLKQQVLQLSAKLQALIAAQNAS